MESITLNARDHPPQSYTVFFDRAEAKREFTGIKLAKGLNEVAIENLPPTLLEDYLGVDGKGPALIVDVRCSSQYANPQEATGSESSQRLQALQKEKKRMQSDIEFLKSKELILKDVLVAYARNDKFDFSEGLDTFDEKKLAVRRKCEEVMEELSTVEKKIQEIGIDAYSPGHRITGKTVKVSLEAEAPCEVALIITTIMENVTFSPHYTLRAESTGNDSSLQIRYQARISNNSGEDWSDVSLAISTAQASETTVVPQLMRWTVDFLSPAVNSYGVAKSRKMASAPRMKNMNMPFQQVQAQTLYALPRGGTFGGSEMLAEREEAGGGGDVDLTTAAAEVSEGITSTFIIPGRQTIKDGEKSHTVVIRDLTLDGKFSNICVPKVKDCAYLHARVKNHTDYPLLPGEVAIFLDGAFVGKTEFSHVAPGEYLNVCLGVDKGITVKYHPRQTITSRRGMVLSRSTVQGYVQLITIRNLKSSPLQKLTIIDQIPISEDKAIIVNMIRPSKDHVINVLEKDNQSGFSSLPSTSSKLSFRGSISEKGEKEKDKILWNPDTGKVIWDFIDVKEKKTVEVGLEWEIVSGDRTVHSHFGDKI